MQSLDCHNSNCAKFKGTKHACAIFKHNSFVGSGGHILGYGENQHIIYPNNTIISDTVPLSIHAEDNAIRKLKNNTKKKLIKVDMLVIKVSSSERKLGISLPCTRCLYKFITALPMKGYSLQNIYYSTETGQIEKINLNHLVEDSNKHHVTKFDRKKNNFFF
jgi:cytidine deaminase